MSRNKSPNPNILPAFNDMRGATNVQGHITKDADGKRWLTMRACLDQDHGPSKSGKTVIVASTHGNTSVDGEGTRVSVNIYRPGKSIAADHNPFENN